MATVCKSYSRGDNINLIMVYAYQSFNSDKTWHFKCVYAFLLGSNWQLSVTLIICNNFKLTPTYSYFNFKNIRVLSMSDWPNRYSNTSPLPRLRYSDRNVCCWGNTWTRHAWAHEALPDVLKTWWRHQMETFSALLTLRAGNSPVTCEFPAQKPVTRSFDVFFHLRPNKCLSKQSQGLGFETPSCSLWRHCNVRELSWCKLCRHWYHQGGQNRHHENDNHHCY